jgi:LytR cell envelope-related transcriptional attenuator
MNDRVPDSTGLPLRAMVMVLLFLGVIFLLVGFQAMGSGSNTDDDSPVSSATTSSAAPKTSTKVAAAVKADVRVYNISGQAGIASKAADQIKQGGYNVTEIGNLTLPKVSATTVYFGSAAGEQETAEAVGKLLKAPVAARTPDVSDQPPGVIVVVAG